MVFVVLDTEAFEVIAFNQEEVNRVPPLMSKLLLAAICIWSLPLQWAITSSITIGVWVKIRYPNNWMVNTKLD